MEFTEGGVYKVRFEKKTKFINYGMEFTHGVRRALMFALALLYFLSLGFSVISVTTLFAISILIMTLFEFPTGAIADYDSRKKSLLISFLLLSIAFFGLFIFSNFWLLAVSWILGDIAWSFSSGASSAWVIDSLDYSKKKSKILALVSKSYFFEKSGHVVGGLVGLVLVAINFRFVWLFVSMTNLFMFFVIAKYMEERNFKPARVSHNHITKSLIKAKESFSYINKEFIDGIKKSYVYGTNKQDVNDSIAYYENLYINKFFNRCGDKICDIDEHTNNLMNVKESEVMKLMKVVFNLDKMLVVYSSSKSMA